MVQAVAKSGQPTPALHWLCAAYWIAVGFDLFTVTLMKPPRHPGGTVASGYRVYSTSPETFAAVVEVPFGSKEWINAMIVDKRKLVMDTVDDYRIYYEGWASLQEAGFQSAANLPVIINDATVGTINLLSRTPAFFTAERIEAAERLQMLAALTLLICERHRTSLPMQDTSARTKN
jgi:GAF domain-containing protein